MSTIDEIKRALELCKLRPDRMNFSALELMIAAALADAERKGAEAMRASVESALDDLPLPDGFFVSDIMGAINDALPMPTSKRQAVLLEDEDQDDGPDDDPWLSGDYLMGCSG